MGLYASVLCTIKRFVGRTSFRSFIRADDLFSLLVGFEISYISRGPVSLNRKRTSVVLVNRLNHDSLWVCWLVVGQWACHKHEQNTRKPCAYKDPNNRNSRWQHEKCRTPHRGRLRCSAEKLLDASWRIVVDRTTRLIRTHGEASCRDCCGVASIHAEYTRVLLVFQKKVKNQGKGGNCRGTHPS